MSISVPRDAPERLTAAVRTTSPLTRTTAPLGVWRHRGIASAAWIVGCRRCYWWRGCPTWRGAYWSGREHLATIHWLRGEFRLPPHRERT